MGLTTNLFLKKTNDVVVCFARNGLCVFFTAFSEIKNEKLNNLFSLYVLMGMMSNIFLHETNDVMV